MMIDFVLADVTPVLGRCLPNLLICQCAMVDGNHRADVKPIFTKHVSCGRCHCL